MARHILLQPIFDARQRERTCGTKSNSRSAYNERNTEIETRVCVHVTRTPTRDRQSRRKLCRSIKKIVLEGSRTRQRRSKAATQKRLVKHKRMIFVRTSARIPSIQIESLQMILPAQHIRALTPPVVSPFSERKLHVSSGMTYGLGPAGYDVRIEQHILLPPGAFALASTFEQFHMPDDLIAFVHDKSTWARKGLAVQNTVIEPGWRGYLTLELTNHSDKSLKIDRFAPIAQIIFHRLEAATDRPYAGRYQDQLAGPQPALLAQPGDAI